MQKIKVYIAAGWFDPFQMEALDYLEKVLFADEKFEVFSPRKEVKLEGKEGKEMQDYVFSENCKHVKDADLIISSTVSKDMGTLFETGYAYGVGTPVIYTLFDKRFEKVNFNLMLAASGIATFTDKEKFEAFLKEITPENVSTIRQDYEGDFE